MDALDTFFILYMAVITLLCLICYHLAGKYQDLRKTTVDRKEALIASLESDSIDDNVHWVFEKQRGFESFDHQSAIDLHNTIIDAIPKWDEHLIFDLRQFALGTRAGWLHAGLISKTEHRTMVKEIEQAVLLRLKEL